MRSFWRWLVLLVVVIAVVFAVALAVVYSGVYSVAADYPDRRPVGRFLRTTMSSSVRHHAKGTRVPPLDDPSLVRTGFQHYREMCVGCHGAPGISVDEAVRGFNPSPPALVDAAGTWKPNELFWITKHGVRMSAMPAWGTTHPDDAIWAIVAFTRRLPKMTPEEYQTLDRQTPRLKMD